MDQNNFRYFLEGYLYAAIRRLRIARPVLLMDNARYHFTPLVRQYINMRDWTIMRQDPYSPDQNPCDSHGFRQLKAPLRGRRFASRAGLLNAFEEVVDGVIQNNTFSGITELPQTWQAIIDSAGHYVH